MPLSPDSKAELEVLSNIRQIAASISQHLNDNLEVGSSVSTCINSTIPNLELEYPADIFSPLYEVPLQDNIRQQILQRLNRFSNELRQGYLNAYAETCLKLAQRQNIYFNVEALKNLYKTRFQQRCLPLVQSQVSFVIAEVAKYQTPMPLDIKPSFNNDFTPILMTYFQYNGFPSLAHRSILAQKSGMTLRQIEVWFQNHRKRAKKDGKVVHRLTSDLPLKRALALPSQGHMSCTPSRTPTPLDGKTICHSGTIHDMSYATDRRKLLSCLEETEETHVDDLIRPQHAFPTKRSANYPDPFPNDNGVYRFPPPVWRRKQATTSIIPTAVDMDDFARQFHMRLNFSNNPWKRECTPTNSETSFFSPWFSHLRTTPPSAPLPALQQPRALTAVSTSLLTSTIAKDPFTFVFPKPGESVQRDVTCIVRLPVGPKQSVISITERINRSVDALDRERRGFRVPRRAFHSPRSSTSRLASPGEIAGRKGTPTSRRGPSGLKAFSSRTSSFTSDTSSSSDDSSSPPTPPPMSSHILHSDPVVESNDFTDNFNNVFEAPSSPTVDLTFPKSTSDDMPPTSPIAFNFTFTNPMDNNTQPLPSRAFGFAFSNSVTDGHLSPLHLSHPPLIFT